ncbi:PREDICTED: INO80 complex subunit B, partial [Nanorana parkeri]|uniref:INO80 complex subunit B n=1 Tax=Nanorana parkeri TaxID=125878 RepID=UPI000853F529
MRWAGQPPEAALCMNISGDVVIKGFPAQAGDNKNAFYAEQSGTRSRMEDASTTGSVQSTQSLGAGQNQMVLERGESGIIPIQDNPFLPGESRAGETRARPSCPGSGDEGDVSSHGAHKKKHKKHKKHKKKHHQEVGGTFPQLRPADSTHKTHHKPQLKLKIKLGGQVLGTKNVPTFTVVPEVPQSPLMVVDDDDEPLEGVPIEQYRAWLDEDSNLDPMPSMVGPRETEQDEESRWLDALERGELDVNGDLKREIDETLLTARQ